MTTTKNQSDCKTENETVCDIDREREGGGREREREREREGEREGGREGEGERERERGTRTRTLYCIKHLGCMYKGGAINSLTVVVTFHLEKVCQSCTLVEGSNKVKDKVSKKTPKNQKHEKQKATHPHTYASTRARTHTINS